jgi:hypothetical protein
VIQADGRPVAYLIDTARELMTLKIWERASMIRADCRAGEIHRWSIHCDIAQSPPVGHRQGIEYPAWDALLRSPACSHDGQVRTFFAFARLLPPHCRELST